MTRRAQDIGWTLVLLIAGLTLLVLVAVVRWAAPTGDRQAFRFFSPGQVVTVGCGCGRRGGAELAAPLKRSSGEDLRLLLRELGLGEDALLLELVVLGGR